MAKVTPETRFVVNHMVDPITFFWRSSEAGSKNLPDEHRVVDVRGTIKGIIFKKIERDERDVLSAQEVIELTNSVVLATKVSLSSKKSCYLENYLTLDQATIADLANQVEALRLSSESVGGATQARETERPKEQPVQPQAEGRDDKRRDNLVSAIKQMTEKFPLDEGETDDDLEPKSNSSEELDSIDKRALSRFRPRYLKEFFDDFAEGGFEALRDRVSRSDHMKIGDAEALAKHLVEGANQFLVKPTKLADGLVFVGANNPTEKILRIVGEMINAQTIDGLRRMMVSMDQFKTAYRTGNGGGKE